MRKASTERPKPPNYVRLNVAAEVLCVNVRTIERKIVDGELVGYRFGDRVRLVDLDEVLATLKPMRAARPAPEPGTAA